MNERLKKERLKSMNNEIKEFHPLLSSLFRKLPNIKDFENTHGTQEKGADFVLTKNDITLGNVEYIGVIAKIGQISQTNFQTYKRQIEECNLKRYIIGGKRNIHLNEIWIINNDNITENAKERIYEEYKTAKIKFIDSQKLIGLIDKHLTYYWHEIPLSVSNYLHELQIKNAGIDKSLSLLPSSQQQIYIEPDIVKIEEDEYKIKGKRKKVQRVPVNLHKEIQHENFILIEGTLGSGKSKLLRQLVSYYSNPDRYLETKLLPIIISYRDFCEQYECKIEKLLDYIFRSYPEFDLLDGTKYLTLIDGFDEKDELIDDHIKLLEKLKNEINNRNDVKAILTTRFFNTIYDKEVQLKGAVRLEIAPLTLKKTFSFLVRLCKNLNLKDRIIEDLTKSPLMKDLPRSPIIAILLAKLIDNEAKELPSNMTELFSKYLELVLGRWDINKGLESQKEFETSYQIAMIMSEYFIDNNLNYISKGDLQSKVSDYLEKRNLGISVDKVYEILTKRSGLLIEENANRAMFSHRSFTEFLYSKAKFEKEGLSINKRIFSIYWMNIYFFYIGLKKDCEELLKEIVELTPETEAQEWLKLINISNFLLAGYASPYNIIEESLHKIFIDTAKLYCKIINKEIVSPFSSLPELLLLWWTQLAIRECYSYEFFNKALEGIVIQIDDSDEPEEIRAYSIFFASIVGIELDNLEPLDFLLKKYRDKLPLTVQIGLYNETKSLNDQSSILKQHLKWLRRRVDRIQKPIFKQLFEKPIGPKKIT